jgi:hypothetical protein
MSKLFILKSINDRKSSIANSILNRETITKSNQHMCMETYIASNKQPKKEIETKSQLEKRKTKIKKEKDLIKDGKKLKQQGLKLNIDQEKGFCRFLKEYKEVTDTAFLDANFIEYYIKLYNNCNKQQKLPIIGIFSVDTIEKGELLKQYLNIITKINFN